MYDDLARFLVFQINIFQLIISQEYARAGQKGYSEGSYLITGPESPSTELVIILGMMSGTIIGLPPVLNFGSNALKAKIVPDILSGQKPICLAITEAFAGSDVAGIRTSAVKTDDGRYWIINGT
jgi:alkylation response protein AidB-like acyl-CoA dehydrogenase